MYYERWYCEGKQASELDPGILWDFLHHSSFPPFLHCGFILLQEAILGFVTAHEFKVVSWKMVGIYFSYYFLDFIVRACFPWNQSLVVGILMIFASGFISLYFFWTVVLELRSLSDSPVSFTSEFMAEAEYLFLFQSY